VPSFPLRAVTTRLYRVTTCTSLVTSFVGWLLAGPAVGDIKQCAVRLQWLYRCP